MNSGVFEPEQPEGPAWLGIGAQRSGTTWLTYLLCQHPEVAVPGSGEEQHELYRGLVHPWNAKRSVSYRRLFARDDASLRVGECTPFYLRAPWAAEVATEVLREDVPIFAILRDPVERFESAVRFWLSRSGGIDPESEAQTIRNHSSDALWGGMYATQLECWKEALGHERLTVLQYEAVREDPQVAVNRLWRLLELKPIVLQEIDVPSKSSSNHELWSLDSVDGLRDHLRHIYRDEVKRLAEWGIDPRLWPNFCD